MFGIPNDSDLCHCERSSERVAINEQGIPTRSITALALLARNDAKDNGGATLVALLICDSAMCG